MAKLLNCASFLVPRFRENCETANCSCCGFVRTVELRPNRGTKNFTELHFAPQPRSGPTAKQHNCGTATVFCGCPTLVLIVQYFGRLQCKSVSYWSFELSARESPGKIILLASRPRRLCLAGICTVEYNKIGFRGLKTVIRNSWISTVIRNRHNKSALKTHFGRYKCHEHATIHTH